MKILIVQTSLYQMSLEQKAMDSLWSLSDIYFIRNIIRSHALRMNDIKTKANRATITDMIE